ncbi:hypothetical protein GCM10007874_41410 [Labrys miyagiensis]|uniref:Transposase n=1 Tax=Labrys miyagiensis TaxID=346912 RepID=A0ABQ6CN15_9HYPH|nr:hypothetical protein GCM10007874_41410 [Labrys miyagiensis]
MLRAYHAGGPAALISKKRGRPSNRSYPPVVRTEAIALIKAHYLDFGSTLAAEKPVERHALHFGGETIRRWMMAEGIWSDCCQRLKPVHQPHRRRECFGKLVLSERSQRESLMD